MSLHYLPADNKVEVKIEYSLSADIFEVMDNVANWWPGFNEEEYSKYWDKIYSRSEKDKIHVLCLTTSLMDTMGLGFYHSSSHE